MDDMLVDSHENRLGEYWPDCPWAESEESATFNSRGDDSEIVPAFAFVLRRTFYASIHSPVIGHAHLGRWWVGRSVAHYRCCGAFTAEMI